MAHAPLLGLRKGLGILGLLLFKVGLQLRIGERQVRLQSCETDLDVTQIHGFRRQILALVLLVVSRNRRVVGNRFGRVARRRHDDPGELALLPR